MAFEAIVRRLERHRKLSGESTSELYKLAMEILIAERNLEKRLEEAKTEREKKEIEEKLRRIKLWRDRVIAAYMARCLGTSLPPVGEKPW